MSSIVIHSRSGPDGKLHIEVPVDQPDTDFEVVVTLRPALEQRFKELAARWREETMFSSSATDIVEHPAYRAIIALGPPVVPLIIAELEREPEHWSYALSKITGEDPVPPNEQGRLDAMRDAWLRWARSRGQREKTP